MLALVDERTLEIYMKRMRTMIKRSNLSKIFLLGIASVLMIAQLVCAPAQALSPDDIDAIYNWPYYKLPSCSGGAGLGTGTLPSFIPDPYNSAFTKGANTFKVAPALIAALFTEENFTHIDVKSIPARWKAFPKQHPNPNSGWPTNQFHTMGAFQFIPGTWKGFAVDGDGDGKKDAQNIWDGAAGAAKYVASNGATVDKPPASWQRAIFAYNHAQWYVDAVMTYYNFYKSGGTAGASSAPPGVDSATPTDSSCGAAGAAGCNKVSPGATAEQIGAAVVACAKNELSLWQNKQMHAGYKNGDTATYSKYSGASHNDWCGYFVSWVYKQIGYPVEGSNGVMGLVKDYRPMGERNKKFSFHTSGPKPGDIAIHGRTHVNIVVAVSGKGVTFIGGNQQGGGDKDTNIVSQVTYSADGYDSPTAKW
jgi:hypothetical protein